MAELDPLYEMEDDIHGVRQLLEVAIDILFEVPRDDAAKACDVAWKAKRIVECALGKNQEALDNWRKAFNAMHAERKAA